MTTSAVQPRIILRTLVCKLCLTESEVFSEIQSQYSTVSQTTFKLPEETD